MHALTNPGASSAATAAEHGQFSVQNHEHKFVCLSPSFQCVIFLATPGQGLNFQYLNRSRRREKLQALLEANSLQIDLEIN